ncbi:MAG: hypothetical protein II954_07065 [Synergistaceae bacterium]|nr:hypothetical protein [Synergistaceae bacterium]
MREFAIIFAVRSSQFAVRSSLVYTFPSVNNSCAAGLSGLSEGRAQ